MPEAGSTSTSTFSSSSETAALVNNKFSSKSKNLSKSFFNEQDNDWPTVDLKNLITDLDADIDQMDNGKINSKTSSIGPSSQAVGSSMMSSKSLSSGSAGKVSLPNKISSGSSASSNTTSKIINSSNIGSCSSSGNVTATITESRPLHESGNEKGLKMKIKRTKTNLGQGSCSSSTSISTINSSVINNKGSSNDNCLASTVNTSSSTKLDVSQTSSELSVELSKHNMSGKSDGILEGRSISSIQQSKNSLKSQSNSKTSLNSSGSLSSSASIDRLNGEDSALPQTEAAFAQVQSNGSSHSKKIKVDASVGTEIGTMTEPDCLGPLDPGTSVTLEGIVWHETKGGVLVINVTWRGKTYVGTLLDSTQHVNQWAPPRYSESPPPELDNKKCRGNKRAGRLGSEPELIRKNLRSSKGKPLKNSGNSPSKRKKVAKDDDNEILSTSLKRQRTSSKNSADDDDGIDSERESKDSSEASVSVKENKDKDCDEEMTPKDPKEVKYIPPPPLPYALICPKPGCKKRYRQHNGLRFHISHAHKELLDSKGEIRDTSDIEKCEKDAKERLRKRGIMLNDNNKIDTDSSAQSSKTSTPGSVQESCIDRCENSNHFNSQNESPKDAKSSPLPIIDSESNKIMTSSLSSTLSSIVTLCSSSTNTTVVASSADQTKPTDLHTIASNMSKTEDLQSEVKEIQPKSAVEDKASSSVGENKTAKTDLKKGIFSPISNSFLSSPESGMLEKQESSEQLKSPAYSDISDDAEDESKKSDLKIKTPISGNVSTMTSSEPFNPINSSCSQTTPSSSLTMANNFPFSPYIPSNTSVPTSSVKSEVASKLTHSGSGSSQGPTEYQKVLQAYGFPQLPYSLSSGVDPNFQLQLLSSDTNMKSKSEKDRSEKEKFSKDQQMDPKERDKKIGSSRAHCIASPSSGALGLKPSEDLRKPSAVPSPRSMISVKPEFNVPKLEPGQKSKDAKDEGAKPTMETRGPPPANVNPYGYMHPSLLRPPVGLSYEAIAAAAASGTINPLLLSPNPYIASNPYLPPPHMPSGIRPPYGVSTPDMLRAPYPQGSNSSNGANPEDLSNSVSVGPSSGGSNSSGGLTGPAGSSASTKALDLLQQHASQYYANSHKIHELSDRGIKSPSDKPTGMSTNPLKEPGASRKESQSPAGSLCGANRSRSPPPLRHVHTHTHTHFGLTYPLLHPPSGVAPPAAHTSYTPGTYPSHLLQSSGNKGSIPGGSMGQNYPQPPK